MADVPSGLLEACVVVGAVSSTLRELYQSHQQGKIKELPLLETEVLQVHAPPFVTKESVSSETKGQGHAPAFTRIQRRRSFIKKKRGRPGTANGEAAKGSDGGGGTTEDISVPKDLDLIALPQLCFPGGLQIASEQREDSYHYLVFTDVFGVRTHAVVVQYYRPIQFSQDGGHQNGYRLSSKSSRLYTAYGICVISKYPYYNALRDCLSCLLSQLKPSWMGDFEERVKEFSAKLALVPIPPPGQLHVVFSLRPLQIGLPSREDKDRPAVDLDLHLPFLCFRPRQLLQIITSLLTEQRVVLFSCDWARLTLLAESLMLFIHPLVWQHPFVPVLSSQMLDFLMAPTAYLMGCHLHHYEEVAAETDDLILVNIDDGTVSSSSSDGVDLPDVPLAARECFLTRAEGLQMHYDLEVCHLGSSTDVNDQRAQRRQWQRKLNTHIQNITLELIVNIFREVHDHLNFEHRVFNSEEFFRSREPADQPFFKKVLDTHIFHSFLRDRLNRKMDAFTRMELSTRTEAYRLKSMTESPRRPTMQELARKYTSPESRLSKRLGASLPNLGEGVGSLVGPLMQNSLKKIQVDSGLKSPQKPVRCFKLPEFPPPLAYRYVQNYYQEMITLLDKAISGVAFEDSSLLACYHYLRGFVNTVAGKRLDALEDFQTLYKTDTDIFPGELVNALVDSLQDGERAQANRRTEIKRLISRVKKDHERERACHDNEAVKRFQLPKKHMQLEDFVRHVQESGIVKDQGTIHRLFEALTVGQQKQVDPELFRVFYTFWKETEAEAQEVALPASVLEHLEANECVFKLSSSVKTSHGVGKIAMTQRRLFLLTVGRPGYVEVTKFRDIEEVKISSAPFLLLRIPSLKIKTTLRKETFEVNLKSEVDLWHLMVKEMWAGRKMADDHKDPQYMQQALTNALLMDAVVGCLQSQKAIFAATKLAHFDRMKLEVPMMVPKTTSETLKHKINPSLDLTSPQAVDVLLYTPGQLGVSFNTEGDGNPKLWCALSDGKVVVFDAASWSMQQSQVQVGSSRVNCMLGVDRQQVWIGSQDSVIYIISTRSMSCNKQLTDHRSEVTGLALGERSEKYSPKVAYSCSAEGTVMAWDVSTLQVRKQFRLSCDRLQSVQLCSGTLWCCARDCIMEVWKTGTLNRKISLPEQLCGSPTAFSSFLLYQEKEQLWTACIDVGELCVWHLRELTKPFQRIQLPDCAGVTCLIKVKNQIWVGGRSSGKSRGKIYVVDAQRHTVEKELVAHTDCVQALCSAEDRYVLSGAAREDGKIAIWKVE
ncbi:DENN domain-containing protein 3-like isoform X1 [Salvelinus fontinalis]|uniref:DENN domain-containing protein 3-like isoform X1 n=2 Tax=Salvelinus fontinalis TaxID=8038 RepID=UPI00248661C5|nr:DENN domain-containing protein 3-like isoform X1 [Salvelinus fontinalis]XP_055733214.1 DENN domain-containing protein 3-like isoform X1 [Salvelinus fontinalis]